MTVAQIESCMRRARAKLRRLDEQLAKAKLKEKTHMAVLRDFDAGCTNTLQLANRFGLTRACVNSIIYRHGRSVIAAQHIRRQQAQQVAA